MSEILLGDAGCPVRIAKTERQLSYNWRMTASLFFISTFFYLCVCMCVYMSV